MLDNEIDGEAFMELTESDILTLVVKTGLVKKVIRLRAQINMYIYDKSLHHFVSGSTHFIGTSRVPHPLVSLHSHLLKVQ